MTVTGPRTKLAAAAAVAVAVAARTGCGSLPKKKVAKNPDKIVDVFVTMVAKSLRDVVVVVVEVGTVLLILSVSPWLVVPNIKVGMEQQGCNLFGRTTNPSKGDKYTTRKKVKHRAIFLLGGAIFLLLSVPFFP